MNECDLSDAIRETVAGALNKIKLKLALSVSEEMWICCGLAGHFDLLYNISICRDVVDLL